MSQSPHTWRFFRAGGFDQVRLESGADLLALGQLDQKLWTALACPTTGLEFDKQTLALIDTDKDGRVRAPELIAAVRWAAALLKSADSLVKGGDTLPLAAIQDATPEGKTVLASARTILTSLGKAGADSISLADTVDTARIFAQTAFNGDGVIVAESAEDDATRAVLADIIATQGADTDRSGKPGVNQARVDKFFADAAAFEAWSVQSETNAAAILPAGAGTATASAAIKAVRTKIDDFFGRCRLAAFDGRALAALNREEKEYLGLAAKDLTITAAEVAGFPLAQVAPGRALSLDAGVNPAWAGAIATFRAAAVTPLLGDRTELTEADWAAIQAKIAPYDAWAGAKAGASVEKLGLERIRAILAGTSKATITALIARDKALEGEVAAVAVVDKLIRYHRDLGKLCRNFVNFSEFYGKPHKAIFQAGTLYLDQRSCELCLDVTDGGRHAGMAGLAGTYLAYLDCVRRGTGEKRSIVAAFTDGDSDNLMVGRNGLFYDRQGVDYDATITKIIDNPISIRQAFWSPYKKLVRMIEEQVAKRAAAADADASAQLAAAADTAANIDKTKPADPKKPEPSKIDVGTVAALGVAVGAIGTAFATIFAKLAGLIEQPFWKVTVVLIGLALLISGPSMLIAWLKLRKRNLGPILDANGWAVNAKAKVNVPFGTSLTGVAKLPEGAVSSAVADTFAEPPVTWPKWVLTAWVIAFVYSLAAQYELAPVLSGEAKVVIPLFDKSYQEAKKKKAAEEAAKKAGESAPTTPPAPAPAPAPAK